MPRYDRDNGVRVLYPKTEVMQINVTPVIGDAWLKLCERTGISCSDYIRLLIDLEIDKVLFRVESSNREN